MSKLWKRAIGVIGFGPQASREKTIEIENDQPRGIDTSEELEEESSSSSSSGSSQPKTTNLDPYPYVDNLLAAGAQKDDARSEDLANRFNELSMNTKQAQSNKPQEPQSMLDPDTVAKLSKRLDDVKQATSKLPGVSPKPAAPIAAPKQSQKQQALSLNSQVAKQGQQSFYISGLFPQNVQQPADKQAHVEVAKANQNAVSQNAQAVVQLVDEALKVPLPEDTAAQLSAQVDAAKALMKNTQKQIGKIENADSPVEMQKAVQKTADAVTMTNKTVQITKDLVQQAQASQVDKTLPYTSPSPSPKPSAQQKAQPIVQKKQQAQQAANATIPKTPSASVSSLSSPIDLVNNDKKHSPIAQSTPDKKDLSKQTQSNQQASQAAKQQAKQKGNQSSMSTSQTGAYPDLYNEIYERTLDLIPYVDKDGKVDQYVVDRVDVISAAVASAYFMLQKLADLTVVDSPLGDSEKTKTILIDIARGQYSKGPRADLEW